MGIDVSQVCGRSELVVLLTWLPTFFNDNKVLDTKLDLKTIGCRFLIIYLVSDFGFHLLVGYRRGSCKNGMSLNAAARLRC